MSRSKRPPRRDRGGRQAPRDGAVSPRSGRARSALLAFGAVGALALLTVGVLVLTGGWGGGAVPRPDQARLTPPSQGERPAAKIDASGRLLLVRQDGLTLLTLPDRQERPVVAGAGGRLVTGVRWRPDGAAAVYSLVYWRPGDNAPRSALYLTELAGDPQPLIQDDRPGAILGPPAWSPDGVSLYVPLTVTEGRLPVQRLERVEPATGTRTPIGEGSFPDVSPDGSLLAVVRSTGGDQSLALIRPDGSPVRTLIDAGRFTLIGSPRFSPDGREIAVALGEPPRSGRQPSPPVLFGLLETRVAHAHGNPSEIYVLDVAGGQLRRLTSIAEDEPTVAWSPDGSKMAVYATRGLYLIDRQGRATLAVDTGGYGGLDWAP